MRVDGTLWFVIGLSDGANTNFAVYSDCRTVNVTCTFANGTAKTPIHNIMSDVPPENVVAAFEAVNNFNGIKNIGDG